MLLKLSSYSYNHFVQSEKNVLKQLFGCGKLFYAELLQLFLVKTILRC